MTSGVRDWRTVSDNVVRENLSEMMICELEKDIPNGGTEQQSLMGLGVGMACSGNRRESSVAKCEDWG